MMNKNNHGNFNNILVHSLVNIGDVLLSTSAVALLRQIYPGAKITMMVRPNAADLVLNNPVIDEVIIYDYKAKHRSIKSMWRMVKLLKKKKFDLSISFDRKLRPAVLTFLAGIPVRVAPDKVFDDKSSHVTKLYTHVVKINHDLKNTLQADTYQSIVKGFAGIKSASAMHSVMASIKPQNEQKAASLLNRLEISPCTKKIALCVKGTFPLKTWPGERFVQVVDKLAKKYHTAAFIVGAPEDREYADEVIALAKTKIANFCGETNLVDLAALLKKADIFITVDTGATHIAATTSVPLVVVYGCTSPKRWHPLTEKVATLTTNEECCPCSVPVEGCLDKKCLMNILVEEVYGAAEKMLFGDN